METFTNSHKCLNCHHCFKQSPIFGLLSDKELETMDNARMEVNFKKGEIIYKQGTPLTHIVILHTGFGKVYIEGSKGKNLILRYTKQYDLNGGVGVFLDQRHHSSLLAVTDCGACFIDIHVFKKVMLDNPAFMEEYLKLHSQTIAHFYHQIAVLTQKNMEGRMAESIIYLKDVVFNNDTIENISKQDLAELTAMTKESALRVLKEFKDEGLIEFEGQTIHILDSKALEQISLHG